MQIVNMTGNNAVDEILIPVTDGQLNIRAGAGKDKTAFSICNSSRASLKSPVHIICAYSRQGQGYRKDHFASK